MAQPWRTSQPRTARSDGAALQCFRTWSRQRRQRLEPNDVRRPANPPAPSAPSARLRWSVMLESEPRLATVATAARPNCSHAAVQTALHFSELTGHLRLEVCITARASCFHICSGGVSWHLCDHFCAFLRVQVGSSPGRPRSFCLIHLHTTFQHLITPPRSEEEKNWKN